MFAHALKAARVGAASLIALAIAGILLLSQQTSLHASDALWTYVYGGSLASASQPRTDATPVAVAMDVEGFAYVTGSTAIALEGQTLSGLRDAFVQKYNASTGAVVWTRQFGSVGENFGNGIAVHESASGIEVFVAGEMNNQLFLRKYDGDGNELWTYILNEPGYGLSLGYDVAVNADGEAFVGGEAQFNGVERGVIVRLEPDGRHSDTTYLTAVYPSELLGQGEAAVTSVKFTSTGRLVIGGFTDGPLPAFGLSQLVGTRDAVLIQMGIGGTVDWANNFGTPGGADEVMGVAVGPDDSVYAVGLHDISYYKGGSFVRKYDSNGYLQWTDTKPADYVRPTPCDVTVDPVSGSVHIVGTDDWGYNRLQPCQTSTFLPTFNNYTGEPNPDFDMFIDSFDAAGHRILRDTFKVPPGPTSHPEFDSDMPTGFGIAQYGADLVIAGVTETYDPQPCGFNVSICPDGMRGDYMFVSRRDHIPTGSLEMHADVAAVTTPYNQPVTITGTYDDANGLAPTFSLSSSSPSASVLTTARNGDASGTWSATFASVDPGTHTLTIVAEDADKVRAEIPVQVTVGQPPPLIVQANTSQVTVEVGQGITVSGTYEVPSAIPSSFINESLTASLGTLERDPDARMGDWQWSVSQLPVGTYNISVTLSLDYVSSPEQTYHMTGSGSFVVNVLPFLPPIVRADNNATTVRLGEISHMTGTYQSPAGSPVTLTTTDGHLIPQSGGASGTWRWYSDGEYVLGTRTVVITAANANAPDMTSTTSFQVTTLPLEAPALSAKATTVSAPVGGIAANSGTYLDPSGNTPTITASSGTVTQSSGPDGTWHWSQTVGASGPVTISAQDGGLTSTTSFQVNASNSTTTVVSQGNPPDPLGDIIFTAVVAPTSGDQTPISGSVQFVVNGLDRGTPVPLTGGAASLLMALNGAGPYTIGARYSGDGNELNASAGTLSLFAENPNAVDDPNSSRQFGTTAADHVLGMTPDVYGGYIAAGLWNGAESEVSGGWYPIEVATSGEGFVRHYTQLSTEAWTAHISAGALTVVHAVAADSGHVYVVGETDGALDGQTSAGGRDAFVQAYSRGGDLLWTRQFGSASDDVAYGVAVDRSGLVYVVGVTPGLPGQPQFGAADGFLRQYDSTGAERWTREFGTTTTDEFLAVATTGADRVAVTGYTGGSVLGATYDGGGEDLLVTEWTNQGLELWARQTGSGRNEQGLGVAGDEDGNVYVAGVTNGNLDSLGLRNLGSGQSDGVVIKYDANGVVQWSREVGTDSSDVANAIAVDAVGRVAVAGGTSDGVSGFSAHVWHFRGDGTPDGDSSMPGAKYASAIMFDHYGGLEVGGVTVPNSALEGQTSAGGLDAFVVRSTDAAPVIITQPLSRTARPGDQVAFVAAATNGWPWWQTVQWEVKTPSASDFSPIAGANQQVYSVAAAQALDGNQYRVVFSNATGSATSDPATLHVHAPVITLTADSSAVTVTQGQVASVSGTYDDPVGLVPTFTAALGTVTVSPETHSWTWTLATSSPIATRAVTIYASDGSLGSGTTSFNLTVLADTVPPVITAGGNFTVEGGGPITLPVSAMDAIDGPVPVVCNPASGAVLPVGPNPVSCTATDRAGNEAQISFVVTVVDTTAPTARILGWDADTIFHDTTTTVQVQAEDAIGVTAVTISGIHASLVSGTAQSGVWEVGEVPTQPAGYDSLPTELTASATDAAGHTAEAPSIEIDGDGIAAAIDTEDVAWPGYIPDAWEYSDFFTLNDDHTAGYINTRGAFNLYIEKAPGTTQLRAHVEGSRVPAAFAGFKPCWEGVAKEVRLDVGGEQVLWSCATGGELTITAEVAKPTVDVFKGGSASLSFLAALAQGDTLTTGSPFVADPGNHAPIVVTIFNAQQPIGSFSLDPGESADAVPATGPHGEDEVQLETLQGDVTFTVNGQETTIAAGDPPAAVPTNPDLLPPVIGAVSNITVEATSAAGATVSFPLASVTDDVDPAPTVTVSLASGTAFPIGTTPVTITATDAAGHSSTAQFTVTVQDTTPPVLTLPEPVSMTSLSAAGTPVSWSASALDVVDGSLPVSCAPPSGSLFGLGTTLVQCGVTDAHGNTANGSFAVTIVDQPPTAAADAAETLEETPVTIAVLANDTDADGGTLALGSVGTAGHGTVGANTDGTVTYTPADAFIGTDTFTYIVGDGQGGSASGTVTVTVKPRPLHHFVVMSVDHTRLDAGVTVVSGNVGANTSLAPPTTHDRHGNPHSNDGDADDFRVELVVGPHVTMQSPESTVVGDSVWLQARSSVYNVEANDLYARGASVLGTRTDNVTLPFLTLPALPAIDAGHQQLTVRRNKTVTLDAGAYGHVRVERGGTLVLTGGLYQFASLDLEGEANLVYRAVSEVRIEGDLQTGERSRIVPDATVSGLTAAALMVEVHGRQEDHRHRWQAPALWWLVQPAPSAVRIGAHGVIHANIFAPEGGITIGERTEATGAFVGAQVFVGPQVKLTLDSAF